MANSISAGSSRRAIAARAANAAQQRCAVYFPRLLLDFGWLRMPGLRSSSPQILCPVFFGNKVIYPGIDN